MFLSRSIITQNDVSSLGDEGTNSGVLSGNPRGGPQKNVVEYKTCGEVWQPDLPLSKLRPYVLAFAQRLMEVTDTTLPPKRLPHTDVKVDKTLRRSHGATTSQFNTCTKGEYHQRRTISDSNPLKHPQPTVLHVTLILRRRTPPPTPLDDGRTCRDGQQIGVEIRNHRKTRNSPPQDTAHKPLLSPHLNPYPHISMLMVGDRPSQKSMDWWWGMETIERISSRVSI